MSYYQNTTMSKLGSLARASAARLRKEGRSLAPVATPEGSRNVASSWWGKAWCENLEQYADYENRISRGKRYVRAGAVIDLQIEHGKVTAVVQGSRKIPYAVRIEIDPLSAKDTERISSLCSQRIDSLDSLLAGIIPPDLQELFTTQGGLFPTPREIHFGCSCPDWASMCKHVASALYGIGARFDEDPLMFFRLRGIDADALVAKVVENKLDSMLTNADSPSPRILEEEEWKGLFELGDLTDNATEESKDLRS